MGRAGPFTAGVIVAAFAGCARFAEEAELRGLAQDEGARYERGFPGGDRRQLPVLGEDATLPDYLAYGALNNPGLEAAFHRWRAALERIPQARAVPDPQLTFGWFIQEVETKAGPQRAKLGFMQPLPGPGKRSARAGIALHEAEVARARYEAAKLRLFHRIAKAYWDYWYLARAIAVTQDNLELLGQLEGVARRKYAAGIAQSSALTKVQVELGKLEERLAELRDFRRPTSARLCAATASDARATEPWPGDEPRAESVPVPPFNTLLRALRARSPEIARARHGIEKAEAAVALARRNFRPDFSVGLDYVFTGEASGSVEDSGKDPIMLGFSMSLPLGRSKYRAAEREAEAMRLASARSLEDRENELASLLQMALFRYRDAGRKVELYRGALIPKARQALETVRRAFEADRASFLDLIDAQRALLEFELSEKRALADRAISLSEMKALVGSNVFPVEEEGSLGGAAGGRAGGGREKRGGE
jgi:outer membrane protein TolC